MPVNFLPTARSFGLSARSHKTPRFLGIAVNVFPGRFPILLGEKLSWTSVIFAADTMSHTQPEYDLVRKAGESRFDRKHAF
jgi:hypothetical protein